MENIQAVRPRQEKKRLEFIPGQMILRVRREAIRPALGTARLKMTPAEAGRLPSSIAEPIDYLRRNFGLKDVRPLFSERRSALRRVKGPLKARQRLAILSSVSDSESEELEGIAILSMAARKADEKLVKEIGGTPTIDFIEQMPARWLASNRVDPLQNMQWGLRAIQWFNASIPDASALKLAVLDTGIDKDHPDLKGVIDNYFHRGLKGQDIVGHGTHVAGIIAAKVNNGIGISGVANCKILAWKIFDDQPIQGDFYVSGERYLRALQALIHEGVKVVNLSIGGTASSQTEALLFRRLHTRDITVVAAMGNEYLYGNPVEYPAAYDGVIAVGAIAENRKRASFSNTGKHIDLVAPGTSILSTLPTRRSWYRDETDYAAWSGTSMATPHVAAAAALIASRYPDQKPEEIKGRIRKKATRLPAMGKRKWTKDYGAGLLNLEGALS